MQRTRLSEVVLLFAGNIPGMEIQSADELSFNAINSGLINSTWLIAYKSKPLFILQQLNTGVFTSPKEVQHNYILISEYAAALKPAFTIPAPLFFHEHESLYTDAEGKCWRAFEYIPDSFTPAVAETSEQAFNAASTFAKFTRAFSRFDTGQLKIVIPRFHDLSYRYHQFQNALEKGNRERIFKAKELSEQLQQRIHYKNFYEKIISAQDEFPVRVMHHDAKIANILFSKKTGEVLCPVDFDTVMPGYFFSDIGDMIRSMACSHDENFQETEKLNIREDFYKAILEGYLEEMADELTMSEKKNIHFAGLMMIYMQCLRFITDYFNNDIYYRVDYSEQNFNRAKNQLVLLQQLETFLEKEFGFTV